MAASMDYFAKSLGRRYRMGKIDVEDEVRKEIKGEPLTDVMFVQVNSNFRRKDPNCYIYGHVSVKVGQSTATLFSRDRQAPALVDVDDILRDSISLPDGAVPSPPPPLEPITKSNPILLTMKLHERKSSGEDELMVDVTDLEHKEDMNGMEGWCRCYEIASPDFFFVVVFALIWGARAEIEVKIKEEEGGGKSPVPVNAKIEAIQYLEQCQAVRTLYHNSEYVNVGDKLLLQRSVFGLPMRYKQFLSVLIRPVTVPTKNHPYSRDEDENQELYMVDFSIRRTGNSFVTNNELTHTKDVPGTQFSVSIKILPIDP